MDYDFFNRLKELYHPVFSKDTTEAQISSAKLAFKQINFKALLRNRIIDYISMYGDFRFFKQENISGDVIKYYSWTISLNNPYWEEFDERVAFIGGYRNCSCSFCGRQETFFIEAFYMNSAGFIYNQSKELIAENLNLFWKYVMEKEYDFHPQIPNSTFDVLKRSGWYKGRKINIDPLIEECMDDDIFLTDIQIAFVEEFGGIKGLDLNNFGFFIGSSRENRCFANITKQTVRTEEKWILNNYGCDTICVGFCNDGADQIWLTSFGQIVVRQEAIGRTIIEGINCLLGY